MAEVTITIPDGVVGRVLDAFDARYPGRPGNVTRAQWAKRKVADYVRDVTVAHERDEAREAAARTAEQAANAEIDVQ